MIILSIETSCDDTGVALLEIEGDRMKILSDFVSSQVEIHAPYGGVVPNLAVRAHYKNLPILLEAAFKKVDPKRIDLVSVTVGPGLEPCLWAGVRTARMLAVGMKKPIVGVNHLEGHIAANWLKPIRGMTNFHSRSRGTCSFSIFNEKEFFPAICLIVSGGHTQLVLVRGRGKYKVLGRTRDDAAGEAFDKVAKLLGLGYPGGPEIASNALNRDSRVFELSRPMIDAPNYDFSFSGLKTAVLYLLRDLGVAPARRNKLQASGFKLQDLCASFQQAVVDVLVSKTIRAAKEYKVRTTMLSGGVAANKELRRQMARAVKAQIPTPQFLVPGFQFCTDNAVMIGLAGYRKYKRSGGDKISKIIARSNLNL